MRALVTGASGFLGSHICHRLVEAGHEVRALVRAASRLSALPVPDLEIVRGDVTEPASVDNAVAGCAWVIHAAALISYWERDAVRQREINEVGTRNVAEACRRQGVARLVHVSSVAAVGIPNDRDHPADEQFPFNLEGSGLHYHLSKRRAENVVLEAVARGLDAVIVNPATIFGAFGQAYRGAEMLAKIRRTRIVPYFTGGLCVVHADDVVDGILEALRRGVGGQRYILGGENLTYRDLADLTARAMGLRRLLVPLPPVVTGTAAGLFDRWGRLRERRPPITRTVHYCASRFQYYDWSKARRQLGFTARTFSAILDECLGLGAC